MEFFDHMAERMMETCAVAVRAVCALRFLFMSKEAKNEALCHAVMHGEGMEAEASMLVRFGADPMGRDHLGNTPLHWAVNGRQSGMIKWLVENMKVDVNAGNQTGETPLHWAAKSGEGALARHLVGTGAKADAKDIFGEQPVHKAAAAGHVVMLQYLVEDCGCQADAQDDAGMQPLHYAAQRGRSGVVMYLVQDRKCAVDAASNRGTTPLAMASTAQHDEAYAEDPQADFAFTIPFLERAMPAPKLETTLDLGDAFGQVVAEVRQIQRRLGSLRRKNSGPVPTM